MNSNAKVRRATGLACTSLMPTSNSSFHLISVRLGGAGKCSITSDTMTNKKVAALMTKKVASVMLVVMRRMAMRMGAMTRDPLIWAEFSDTAPARFSRPTKSGSTA